MKNTAVFFLLALSGYVLASTEYEGFDQNKGLRDFITDLINNTINNVVKNMSDPLTIQNITLKLDNYSSLSGQGNVTNMSLSGVSDIIAPYLKVDILSGTINVTIELPKTLITFHYWLDAVFADLIPLYGSGFSTLSLDHVFLNISAGFSLTGGMHVQNVSVVPKINNATFNLDGLLNNSQMTSLINAILDDKACDFIDRCSGTISKIVSPVVQKFINDALKYNGTTVQDVIPHEIYL